MRAAYNGHEALTFGGYLDLETGKTLHAVPGGVYDIGPASGNAGPEIPVPWFTPLEAAAGSSDGEEGAPEPEPEPAPEIVPVPGPVPETEEPAQS